MTCAARPDLAESAIGNVLHLPVFRREECPQADRFFLSEFPSDARHNPAPFPTVDARDGRRLGGAQAQTLRGEA
jgi:hypothetical protein